MEYLVTIGIPVYNSAPFIRRSLESALAQTFGQVQFLVCDDGCTDGSIEIVEEYRRTHLRGKDIRIVHQPRNMGLGNARNRIIAETRTRYLYHMDADDAIAPNAIELLYRATVRHDAEIVYGSHERIDEIEGGKQSRKAIYPSLVFEKPDEFAQWAYRKYDGIQAMTWNFLIDVDVYRKNGLCHQPVNFWEDFSLTIDLPAYITRAVLLSDITYYYYCREGSLSHFERHEYIAKEEIVRTVNAISHLKERTPLIRGRVFFPQRMYKVMVTDFYIVDTILKNRRIIAPPFTNREIRDIMHSPLSFAEILRFKAWRLRNLFLYMLGVVPAFLVPLLVSWAVKISKLRHGCFGHHTSL